MKTPKELEDEFTAKLRALLAEYNADLTAEDHYPGYAECGSDIRMTATLVSKWAPDYGEQLLPWVEIDLGKSVWGSEGMLKAVD